MRAIAALPLILFFTCPPPEPPRRQIVVFHDISLSLASDQNDESMKIVNDIVDKAPADMEIFVIPICENTEDAPHRRLRVPRPSGLSKKAQAAVQDERDKMKAGVTLQTSIIRTQTTAASSNYSSCISPALRRAARTAAAFDATDVVLVSDMIEECSRSLLQEPVQLKVSGNRFEHARRLVVREGSLFTSPANTRIMVFRPRGPSTAEGQDDHPPSHLLEDFWVRLFSRCGLEQSRVYWDADIDHYLASL